MPDKEVGKLWRVVLECRNRDIGDQIFGASRVESLIRKLVEDRAHMYFVAMAYPKDDIERALRDFGISEESWKTRT